MNNTLYPVHVDDGRGGLVEKDLTGRQIEAIYDAGGFFGQVDITCGPDGNKEGLWTVLTKEQTTARGWQPSREKARTKRHTGKKASLPAARPIDPWRAMFQPSSAKTWEYTRKVPT